MLIQDNYRIGMVTVSRFTRAYNAALTAAQVTRTHAATLAGMKQSVLSRLLNDERPVYAEHVERMLRAIPELDREHCLRAFLLDQVPEEYREKLIVNFGSLREEAPRRPLDPLTRDLLALEHEAENNPDLRKVLSNLAALLANSDPRLEEERATYEVSKLLDAAPSSQAGRGASKQLGTARPGRGSSGSKPATKPAGKGAPGAGGGVGA